MLSAHGVRLHRSSIAPVALAFAALILLAPVASMAAPRTKTSTASRFKFPEEGGPLPRAPIPQGSAEEGREGATEPEPEPEKEPEAGPPPHETAPETAPARPPEPALETAPEEPHPERPRGEVTGNTQETAKPKLELTWGGYLKVIAEAVENDPESAFIGRNDGFRIGNARLGLLAAYGDALSAYLSLEASVPRAEDFNQPNAELTVGPRDLMLNYLFSKYAGVSLGRFKAPYDLGELEDEAERTFIDVPLESRGVAPTQGFELAGMRQGRQIGVLLHRSRIGLSRDGFDMGYALALTNGRTEGLVLNDNDRPAGFARFSFFWSDMLTLNLGGFTDTRTVGELPNLFDEEVKGAEGSLIVRLGDLRIEGQILFQRVAFPTTGAPRVTALGFHGQWSYRLYGLEASYRFAYYDPNDRYDVDAVNEHTLGLSYYVSDVPLRFTLNGTLVQEQKGRELENNRLALLAIYTF